MWTILRYYISIHKHKYVHLNFNYIFFTGPFGTPAGSAPDYRMRMYLVYVSIMWYVSINTFIIYENVKVVVFLFVWLVNYVFFCQLGSTDIENTNAYGQSEDSRELKNNNKLIYGFSFWNNEHTLLFLLWKSAH